MRLLFTDRVERACVRRPHPSVGTLDLRTPRGLREHVLRVVRRPVVPAVERFAKRRSEVVALPASAVAVAELVGAHLVLRGHADVDAVAPRPAVVREDTVDVACRKRVLFSPPLVLCLSRACLDKLIVFSMIENE